MTNPVLSKTYSNQNLKKNGPKLKKRLCQTVIRPSRLILHISAVYSHFQQWSAISGTFMPLPVISSHFQLVQQFLAIWAIYSHLHPFPAVCSNSSYLEPFPAIPSCVYPCLAITSHFEPFQPFQTFPAISVQVKPFQVNFSNVQPFSAIVSH